MATVSAPKMDPPTVGANWTSTMQVLFAAREPPEVGQVVPLGWIWKSGVVVMLVRVIGPVLLFAIVAACAALVEPAACDV